MVLHALHLCSGYAGFELALRLAGIGARTVAHVERDSYAAAALVARMADQALDQAPIWSDLNTFDARPFAGKVDLVTAGLPCQPFSQAGQRAGLDDERHLWPMARRIISDVGPRLVLLENVPLVVRAGWLTHVLADLADLGFDAEWGLLSAAAIGAPHRRERFWLLAFSTGDGRLLPTGADVQHRDVARHGVGAGGAYVGDTGSPRRQQDTGSPPRHETCDGSQHGDVVDGASENVAHPEGRGRQSGQRDAIQPERPRQRTRPVEGAGSAVADTGRLGGEPGLRSDPHQRPGGRPDTPPGGRAWPPGPDDIDGWRQWIAEGGPQPQVRRRTNGRPVGLADALHLGGNGLVPSVAAHALVELARRAGIELT